MPVVEALALSGAKIGHGGDRVALVVTELLEKFGLPDLIRVLELALVLAASHTNINNQKAGGPQFTILTMMVLTGPKLCVRCPYLVTSNP